MAIYRSISLLITSCVLCACSQSPQTINTAQNALTEAEPHVTPSNSATFQANSVSSRTIRNLSLKIVRLYDHNLNRQVDYRESNTFWKSLIGRNESERRQTRYHSKDKEVEFRVWEYSLLFLGADEDNDGIATLDEITDFITTTYDKDNDGILKTRGWWRFWKAPEEWEFFKREMPETYRNRRIPTGFTPPAGSSQEQFEAEQTPSTHFKPEAIFPDQQQEEITAKER